MVSKKYLVTGGTGFIGSALVEALVKQGHQVSLLDDESRGNIQKLSNIANEIEFFQADIRNSEAVQKACKGIDCVCHLAFINGTNFLLLS